jgi:ribonuclease J
VSVRLTLLGGVGEFGRNCLVIDDDTVGASLVVDCGIKIDDGPGGDEEQGGRRVLLPDLEALAARAGRVCGYALTHGHDDHIGALPDAMARCPAPVFGAAYTRRRVRGRFKRAGRPLPELMKAELGTSRRIGPFEVTWTAVSHSHPRLRRPAHPHRRGAGDPQR